MKLARANDELTHTVFQIVHQLEIPSEDFQVTDLAVSPIRRVKWEALEGYLVERSFSVRHPEVRDC